MIPMYDEPCPLDGSKLLMLGGRSAWKGKFDVAYYYCPRCDAGFVCWANPAYEDPVIFTWRRNGNNLTLNMADVPKVPFYLRHGWLSARSAMIRGVRRFLRGRITSDVTGCPNDGCKIPLMAEVSCRDVTLRFFWCPYCREAFAYLWDDDYGWQCVASFFHEKDGYKLRNLPRDPADRELIEKCTAGLPEPSTWYQRWLKTQQNKRL
jgi:hypothetical protein